MHISFSPTHLPLNLPGTHTHLPLPLYLPGTHTSAPTPAPARHTHLCPCPCTFQVRTPLPLPLLLPGLRPPLTPLCPLPLALPLPLSGGVRGCDCWCAVHPVCAPAVPEHRLQGDQLLPRPAGCGGGVAHLLSGQDARRLARHTLKQLHS